MIRAPDVQADLEGLGVTVVIATDKVLLAAGAAPP
ncbi:hypothetical protein J2X65_004920 [Ancylobacter sp. 3268]|nr:hypothetical protein [Ancylobacter sp. 3268]